MIYELEKIKKEKKNTEKALSKSKLLLNKLKQQKDNKGKRNATKLEENGAEKFWWELQKLKGEQYIKYYIVAMEFFKPKHPSAFKPPL